MPDAEATGPELDALADGLRALSNAKRLAVLGFLRTPLYVEEIASKLKISRQAAQEHVAHLLEAGLVEKHAGTRPTGPVVEYRVVQPTVFALIESLRALGAVLPEPGEDQLMRTQAGAIDGANLRGELPELVVVGGLKPGLHAALHRGSSAPPVLMGRDPAGGLVIDWDLMVSNRHAEVRALATGYQIVDLYSRNGTFVNGARLRPGTPAALRSGDIVQLGRTSLVFRD